MATSDQHKASAVKFLQLASSGFVSEAYATLVAAEFKHHNPWYAAGAAALRAGMEENAKQNPEKKLEVLRALGEGELVAVHSRVRMKPGAPAYSVIHLFRFENGRIAELWDLGTGEEKDSPNADGLF
jgi:predicted SnoaL-like aldol condensation-catalyzing enzyme